MRIKSFACALVVAFVAVGPAGAEPLKIRMSWVAPVTNWASIWLEKKDLAKHFGQSYLVEPTQFQGTPPMVTALATNQIEISNLAYSTLGIAIENAGLNDLRIVADEFQDGVTGYYSQEYMVLKDSTIHKVEDLKGKVIASNAAGSAIDIAMRAMLAEHKVDLIPAVLPFSYDPQLRDIARDLFVQKDAIGVTDMIVWTMRKPFIDKNRPVLVDFFEDTLRITRWYLDPTNHDAVLQIAARLTKRPPQSFDWLFTKRDTYRDPDMLPNHDALQKNVDLTHELGFVKSSFNVKAYSDLSMVEDAAKRFK